MSQFFQALAVNKRSGRHDGESYGEVGASRLLLEGHIHFDMVDSQMDFSSYKVLILPDDIFIDNELQDKLATFLDDGGKLIMSGYSGLKTDGVDFAFDIGAINYGTSQFQPDFILPAPEICPDYVQSPIVMYQPSRLIKVSHGHSLGQVFNPYFNRTYQHYCSHQHAPCQDTASGFDAGVVTDNILYFCPSGVYHLPRLRCGGI